MTFTTTAAQSGQNACRGQGAATCAVDYAGAPGAPNRCVLINAHIGAGHDFLAGVKRAAHGFQRQAMTVPNASA
jgi:hypothetical protein